MIDRLRQAFRHRASKLTFSLVLLTLSVLLIADSLKLRGSEFNGQREARKVIAETLAVQLSALASVSDSAAIRYTVASFVNRNADVVGAALLNAEGEFIESFGDDDALAELDERSSLNRISVPIYEGNTLWGTVGVAFSSESGASREFIYFGFILAASALLYWLFLARSLAQLDPSRTVPQRVNSAFNLLSEGVVILDDRLRIIMANDAVCAFLDRAPSALVGEQLDDWPWRQTGDWQAPWKTALLSGIHVANQPLRLALKEDDVQTFMVSCAPIGSEQEGKQGVLVSLDNMTVIERKNTELAQTLRHLRESQDSIREKNRELEALATQDPLTGLSNRRALLAAFEKAYAKARREDRPLSCIMVDIDFFKKVNDTLGHAAGDEVICAVANALVDGCREYDFIGRYGGEEFVVVLPDVNLENTLNLAERLRQSVNRLGQSVSVPVSRLSASFGVAALEPDVADPMMLIDRADQALYSAKQGGRDRVFAYDATVTPLKRSGEDEKVEAAAQPRSPDEDSQALLRELEALVQQRTRDIEQLKEFDGLTGIPERNLFMRRVEAEIKRAERFGTTIGVISLEIRELSRLFADLGHNTVEALTVEIVERLQGALRQTDVVLKIADDHSLSRITANEYGLLLSDLDEIGNAMPVITRIRRIMAKPFQIDGKKIYVGANIGIALYPEAGATADRLLDSAGQARIRAADDAEKISHCFSSDALNEQSRDYIELEAELYEAVQNKTFELYYQPKYDLGGRRVCGMEALMRWEHPERGWISPDDFIPIAESNGLIHQISDWVAETAMLQLKQWHDEGIRDLRISINISPLQLRDTTLVPNLLKAMSSRGLPHRLLEVELTETTVIDSPQRARIFLTQLQNAGAKVSLDDFGTGYSSLSLLAELPLDYVKIDRSFVDAMTTSERSCAVVESIINMARALKLQVIGEGVETNEQLETLSALGCQEVQGYLIGRPMPAAAATDYLQSQRRAEHGAAG